MLLKISQLISNSYPELDAQQLFDAYWRRENLGSTTIGQGVTIPHIRTGNISTAKACVLKLLNPIDFGAEDKQPVDLVIALVVPEDKIDEHLQLLRTIIKQFSDAPFREQCRHTASDEHLYKLLIGRSIGMELA
ncbi:PTS sugar transporter subunit IIA [Legionella lansingensis]|uniref:PTS sugar transporter subunit IIA n=1 Tax=Legionella lansingensis TaxID=45067 RepID=UPI000AF7107A|nr:PTS sugar transporter subunit IIA [Legionella lansingensis]